MKICKKCGEHKELHEFTKCSKTNGAHPTNCCKDCANKRTHEFRDKILGKARDEADKKRNEILQKVREVCLNSGKN